MSENGSESESKVPLNPNGPGAAALLAAGIGAFFLAVLAIVGDQSATMKQILSFYYPAGPLSGVSTTTIILWLASWILLQWLWRGRMLSLKPIRLAAFILLGLTFILTFPPIADLF